LNINVTSNNIIIIEAKGSHRASSHAGLYTAFTGMINRFRLAKVALGGVVFG
jgi:hypothetical protein